MNTQRTAATAAIATPTPTRRCKQCQRTFRGEATIAANYPLNGGRYDSYCKYCFGVETVVCDNLSPAQRAASGIANVAEELRRDGGRMMRIGHAAGITSGDLGRLLAADIRQYGTNRSYV